MDKYDLMNVIEEYEVVAQKVIDMQRRKIEEDAELYDADELEGVKLTVMMAERSLALQVAVAEKLDQINDKLEILLGKI